MSIREDREYLDEMRKEKEHIEKTARLQEIARKNARIVARDDKKKAKEKLFEEFYEYKDHVKKVLIKKALLELCVGSIYNPSAREKSICNSLVEQYIEETGTYNLLRNMRTSNSYLLRIIQEKVNEHHKKITKNAKAEDKDSQIVPAQEVEKFWKEVDESENVEDITNLIRMRVSNAEEEFINKNQEDKERVKNVLQQTAARIQAAKASDDEEYSNAVEESEMRLAKNQIYKIQHEGTKNVFDKIVHSLSKASLKNDLLKKEYLTEDNKLDVDRIVESARCIYTLLETVSTIKLEKVDEKYIEDTIATIK